MKYHVHLWKEGQSSSLDRWPCRADLLASRKMDAQRPVISVGNPAEWGRVPADKGRPHQGQVAGLLGKALGLSDSCVISQVCKAAADDGSRSPLALDLAALEQSSVIFNQMICQIAAVLLHVKMDDILSPTRSGPRAAFARQLAMYLCHVVGRQTQCAVGHFFDRDRKTVSYACRVIEDFRENRCFDLRLEQVEELAVKVLERLTGFKESL